MSRQVTISPLFKSAVVKWSLSPTTLCPLTCHCKKGFSPACVAVAAKVTGVPLQGFPAEEELIFIDGLRGVLTIILMGLE